jgi:hypothetical protein
VFREDYGSLIRGELSISRGRSGFDTVLVSCGLYFIEWSAGNWGNGRGQILWKEARFVVTSKRVTTSTLSCSLCHFISRSHYYKENHMNRYFHFQISLTITRNCESRAGFVFVWYLSWIPEVLPGLLTQAFRGFLQTFQENASILFSYRSLPSSRKVIVSIPSRLILCSFVFEAASLNGVRINKLVIVTVSSKMLKYFTLQYCSRWFQSHYVHKCIIRDV